MTLCVTLHRPLIDLRQKLRMGNAYVIYINKATYKAYTTYKASVWLSGQYH